MSNRLKQTLNERKRAPLKNMQKKDKEKALPPLEDVDDDFDQDIDEDTNDNVSKFSSIKAAIKEYMAKIFNKILAKFSILKQKKYWIPLVLGHALMFSGIGYFAYWEETHKRSTDYVLETFNTVFEANDPVLLTQILNASTFIDNTHATVHDNIKLLPDFAAYVGELPNHRQFNKNISAMLLNIVRDDDTPFSFDNELDLLPDNLASQLRKKPFIINKELSNAKTNTYILETTLHTVKWGNYPLQLTAQLLNDEWNITEIANLQKIIEIYDNELARKRIEEENYIANNKIEIAKMVNQYLPNPTCTAAITELSGQQVLIIRIEADANNMGNDMVSWTADTDINFENGNLFMQQYFKINGLFHPQNITSNSWNIVLTEEEIKEVSGQKLFCNAKPILVNLPNGEFYQITK